MIERASGLSGSGKSISLHLHSIDGEIDPVGALVGGGRAGGQAYDSWADQSCLGEEWGTLI
jgi:hypothetical protein